MGLDNPQRVVQQKEGVDPFGNQPVSNHSVQMIPLSSGGTIPDYSIAVPEDKPSRGKDTTIYPGTAPTYLDLPPAPNEPILPPAVEATENWTLLRNKAAHWLGEKAGVSCELLEDLKMVRSVKWVRRRQKKLEEDYVIMSFKSLHLVETVLNRVVTWEVKSNSKTVLPLGFFCQPNEGWEASICSSRSGMSIPPQGYWRQPYGEWDGSSRTTGLGAGIRLLKN
ncbi:hypothetical protein NDU88_000121 [Pleurodeles waltl]|uniref:Uncharacterized protein n=1 Tax=Pleurodeles waltl TaxID=8319 RepID=A0AAV7UT58_PLEWA|nr:hypothetical protein NDU88_000121 [Pleurodeles waltl]